MIATYSVNQPALRGGGVSAEFIITFDDPDTSEYILVFDDTDTSEYIFIAEVA